MNKNTVHNFNLVIKNSAYTESPENLAKIIIKELAEVSKEISQHKDIVQVWQEQNTLNTVINNIGDSVGEGVFDTNAVIETAISSNITSSASSAHFFAPSFDASIGGGVSDTTERKIINSFTSASNTLPISEAENLVLDNSISQIYESIESKQILTVPQTVSAEPSVELIKAEIKKKLDLAVKENDIEIIQYWSRIQKAFEEGATAADFYEKPNEMLFTQMYVALKQSGSSFVDIQNFNWEIVREKMIKAIDANILKGFISKVNKDRWQIIKNQLVNEKTNIANLFEQYDELFLLLKEVEGLDNLPGSITVTTKTKIYPNLSADKTYASIGREDVYVFLKNVSEKDSDGSAVNKGAVQIRNSTSSSFIVGESLEFFIDEAFINQKSHQKEDINWVVCNTNSNKETIFKNEGTSFSYNFDKPGIYRIDAYGKYHTVKQKKSAATATFIELKVVAQDIIITPPANAKAEFIRPFAEEKTFKVALKNTEVQTINPLKLYYQIETTITGKTTIISEEKELDSTGIIKLAMSDLGIYKIKVASKDQYGLNKEFKTSVIKNEVTSIGLAEKSSESNIFLLGITNSVLTLETKTFRINPPTDDEKEDVRWVVYDANNKPYIAPGFELSTDRRDSKKAYMLKWNSFTASIPQKAGNYTVEAFSDRQKGAKSQCTYTFEVKEPQIAEAYWSWSGGTKKTISSLLESNWINASVPHYNNQTVRIYFYLGNAKTNHYIDVRTNNKGEIFEEVKFDAAFQKAIGLGSKKNVKIGFKLLGIQNSKPYPFKSPANYESDTILSVTTDKKILDVYFTYDGTRVTAQDEVPFNEKGTIITIVAKTQNMVGEEIALKAHKVGEKPSFKNTVTVNSEGVATTSFILKNLDKKLKKGTKINYFVGVEGYSTRHLSDKVVTMVIGVGNMNSKIDEDNLQIIWGGKVSVPFRQKVVAICKELWGEQQKYVMANALMIAMSVETAETFSSSLIQLAKKGYIGVSKEEHKKNPDLVKGKPIGLAQFTKDAVVSLILKEKGILENPTTASAITQIEINNYKQKLALLSPEDQLDYVKSYLMLFNNYKKVKRPEDVYMIIFAPRATGQGDYVDLYKKYLTKEDRDNKKVNPKYKENASMDTKNDGFNKGNNDEIIQSGELLSRYREMKAKGLRYAIDVNEARKLNQVLAEKILKSGKVTFANSHVSKVIDKAMAQDNINDTALGKNAKRSNYDNAPGGEVEIISEILYILYELSKIYKLNISEIAGASHSSGSYHYKGTAIDINYIDGKHIDYLNFNEEFYIKFTEKVIKMGAKNVFHPYWSAKKAHRAENEGLRKMGGKWIPKSDHKDHIHIQI